MATAVFVGAANAEPIVPDLVTITDDGGSSLVLSSEDLGGFQDMGGGLFEINGMGQSMISNDLNLEISDWVIQVDEDPFVSQAFSFHNLGPTKIYTVTINNPVAPIVPTSLIGGSTGGSVTDANFDNAGGLSTVAPTAFYRALIDGAPVGPAADLHPDPFATSYSYAGETVDIPDASFGLPGPSVSGPAINASIGIQNKFQLTSGDSMASTNFFAVIPEPATLLLLGLGTLAGLRLRRRNN